MAAFANSIVNTLILMLILRMKSRLFFGALFVSFVCLNPTLLTALEPVTRTKAVLSTYRLENRTSTSTGFVVSVPKTDEKDSDCVFLVTAGHTLEQMTGTEMTIVSRRRDKDGKWKPIPVKVTIRDGNKPLWTKHESADVAVLPLPSELEIEAIGLGRLADADYWQNANVQPGDFIRCIGFPHAPVFKPSKIGFPLTRLGCIATFPLDYDSSPTFLVDYNTFEGDSGGMVIREHVVDGIKDVRILGLVHGQHFFDQRFQLAYESGRIKERLGLAIIVHSQAIRETLNRAAENK